MWRLRSIETGGHSIVLASVLVLLCEIALVALTGAAVSMVPIWADATPRGLGLTQGFAFGWSVFTALAALVVLGVRLLLGLLERRAAKAGPVAGWASLIAGGGALVAGLSAIGDRATASVPNGSASWGPEIVVLVGAMSVILGVWALISRRGRTWSRLGAALGIGAVVMPVIEAIGPMSVAGFGERLPPLAVVAGCIAAFGLILEEVSHARVVSARQP